MSEQIEIAFNLIRIVLGVGDQRFGELSALAQIATDLDSLAARFRMSPRQYPAAYTTLDKMTPEKVKREIYRPQRDFFWVPLAIALLILTLYHCLALLIAVLRAPGRKQGPKAMEIDGASHGN